MSAIDPQSPARTLIRELSDDALIVFLSDCHIGGDKDRDIFETPDDLAAMVRQLDDHEGPVELVLAGDFFDFLRISKVPTGGNRASSTIGRPEYQDLFATLRRFAETEGRRVVYMPGNHDAEAWWNPEIRAQLDTFVDEFSLSYSARYTSEPSRIVYCEHGNQFDSTNTISDYGDRLDTPLGSHIVTDFIPHVPRVQSLHLTEIDRVFPLTAIPEWIAGRLFYEFITQYVRWLLIPFVTIYVAFNVISYALDGGGDAIGGLILEIGSDVLLLTGLAMVLVLAQRKTNRSMHATALYFAPAGISRQTSNASVGQIRTILEGDASPPMSDEDVNDIAIFVSGHTHAPSLDHFKMPSGGRGALVNSGCWLRQLQPVHAHLGAPTVFVSRFVQTHVRVHMRDGAIDVELWEQPRPASTTLRAAERLAIAGRVPDQPDDGESLRVIAKATIEGGDERPVI
jgi:UDP-2,3-diacylglucosamine pyrophosphatase LpxH